MWPSPVSNFRSVCRLERKPTRIAPPPRPSQPLPSLLSPDSPSGCSFSGEPRRVWPSAPGRHRASRPHGRPPAAAGHHVPLVRSPLSGPLGRVRVSAAVRRAAVRLRVRVSAAASVRIPPGFIREGAGSPGPMASPGVAPGNRAPSSPARVSGLVCLTGPGDAERRLVSPWFGFAVGASVLKRGLQRAG